MASTPTVVTAMTKTTTTPLFCCQEYDKHRTRAMNGDDRCAVHDVVDGHDKNKSRAPSNDERAVSATTPSSSSRCCTATTATGVPSKPNASPSPSHLWTRRLAPDSVVLVGAAYRGGSTTTRGLASSADVPRRQPPPQQERNVNGDDRSGGGSVGGYGDGGGGARGRHAPTRSAPPSPYAQSSARASGLRMATSSSSSSSSSSVASTGSSLSSCPSPTPSSPATILATLARYSDRFHWSDEALRYWSRRYTDDAKQTHRALNVSDGAADGRPCWRNGDGDDGSGSHATRSRVFK